MITFSFFHRYDGRERRLLGFEGMRSDDAAIRREIASQEGVKNEKMQVQEKTETDLKNQESNAKQKANTEDPNRMGPQMEERFAKSVESALARNQAKVDQTNARLREIQRQNASANTVADDAGNLAKDMTLIGMASPDVRTETGKPQPPPTVERSAVASAADRPTAADAIPENQQKAKNIEEMAAKEQPVEQVAGAQAKRKTEGAA